MDILVWLCIVEPFVFMKLNKSLVILDHYFAPDIVSNKMSKLCLVPCISELVGVMYDDAL